MKIIAVANVEQQQEILEKKLNSGAEISFKKSLDEIKDDEYDAMFFLNEPILKDDIKSFTSKPVVINSVTETLNDFPENFSRINGWNGFLKRPLWEIATKNKMIVDKIFNALGWQVVFVKDEPGLVSARVISMIINEAYYALGENVSSENDINLAMKLGTNYPLGPFEWAQKIGLENIYHLLKKLSETDKRYKIAPELIKKFSLTL